MLLFSSIAPPAPLAVTTGFEWLAAARPRCELSSYLDSSVFILLSEVFSLVDELK